MLERRIFTVSIDHTKKVSMQVHGVVHHRSVDHDKAGNFAFSDPD
jgi:hypothetical protein